MDRKPHQVKYPLIKLIKLRSYLVWTKPCIDQYLSTRHFPSTQQNTDMKFLKKCLVLGGRGGLLFFFFCLHKCWQHYWYCCKPATLNMHHLYSVHEWKSCECSSLHQWAILQKVSLVKLKNNFFYKNNSVCVSNILALNITYL